MTSSISFNHNEDWSESYGQILTAPSGGVLFTMWTKVNDPGSTWSAVPNMEVAAIFGDNWLVRGIVANSYGGYNGLRTAEYNANSMLFAGDSGLDFWSGTYVGDYTYYDDYITPTEYKDWVWVAWWVKVGADRIYLQQFLKFGRFGAVFAAGSDEVTFAEIRTAIGDGTWTATDAVALRVGNNQERAANITGARVYTQTSAPSLASLEAIAALNAADSSAWADWPLTWSTSANLSDQSGNNRNLTAGSTLYEGLEGPYLGALPSRSYLVGTGASAAGTVAITVPLPPNIQSGDFLVMMVETANQAISITNTNGGTWSSAYEYGTGTAGDTSATRLTVFTSVYNGTQGNPSLSDSGDHQFAVILAYRAADPDSPVNIYSGFAASGLSSSWTIPGATTTVDNCTVLIIAARSTDSLSTTFFSGWTNSDLTELVEVFDAGCASGNGGGFGVAEGAKTSAGTYGDTTATTALSAVQAYMTIAVAPLADGYTSTGTVVAIAGAPTAAIDGYSSATSIAVNGTHFGTGSSGTYSVPAVGDGEFITLAGWFDLPTILTDDYEFVCIGAVPAPFYLERHTGGPWTLQQDYGELVKTTHTGGKVYLAIVYSKTSCVVFWRHAEHQAVGQITASGFAYNGAAFTGTIADFHGDVQCFGIWQVALTKDQVLAQSLSTSPIISAYSFFPLTANDGTGTIGGRDITLTGTVSASQQVYQTALPEIDITKSTVFDKGDYGGYIRVPYSPFSISYSITVSAWIWLGPGDHNAYVIFLGDETWDEHLLFCHQHADGSTLFETNLMSKETVDWGGSSKTATVGECEGWVFSAWVVTSSGTTRTLVKHYGQFGLSGELTDWGTITAPTCTETGWSPAMQLTVNRPSPENFRVEHVRVHIGELTQSQLAALAISDAPDTTAWVHLPLKDTSPLDVSGNDRHGDVYVEVYSAEGIEFPAPPNTGTITATAGAPTASIDGYSSATSTGIIAATAGAPTASIDGYSSATSTGIIAAIAGAPVASIDGYSEVTSTGTVDATAGAPIASAIGSISSNVGILNAVAGAPVAFIRGSTEDNVGNIVAVAGGPVANIIGYVELDDLVTACAPPVKLYTFDRSLHGVRTVLCNDGYTVALEWHKEYLNPNNWDLVYNIYWSTKQSDVYSEGVKFVFKPEVNDCYLSLNLYGYFDPGKTYYFAVKGAGHDPGTLLFDQLPSGNIPGLKTYPEAALAHDIYPIDLVIPLDDVSGFPSTGIVLIGAELISYSNVDIVNNTLIVAERGLYGYQRRIHTVDGFDGFHYYDNPFVRIFKGWEDENTAVGMIVIKFEDQYARVYQDGYGFRERVDILSGSGNLSVVDAANDGFLAYDQAGWDRTYLPDYLEGKCVGTYFGGEYGCADGNESDGSIRGLGVQDHMNMREEYLLEITGEPVMLFRRMWSGKQSQHTSATLENTTHRGLDTYGTSLVTGYNQYFNPRRSDGKILVRFGPTKEDLKREEFGIENSFIPNCWTLVTPTIKDGDFIIRFNQDGTEEWRYEIIDVDRNRTILQESGAQKFTAVRVRKTDPICQVRSILDTSTEPSEVLTSIGMVSGPGGILAHMHRIVLVNGVCLSQLTSIDQGHNHPVDENNIIGNVLNHSHTIIIP
jgi:hypothetical protein